MSLIDRAGGQDVVQLVRIAAAVSFTLADTERFSYNLPLMLFGVIALELSTTGPEQFFIMMAAFSGFFDVLSFIMKPPQSAFTWIFALGLCLVKMPIYFSGLTHLRERGGDLNWASRGFSAAGTWMPASMGGGGQTLGGGSPSATPAHNQPPPPPGAFPSGGYRLGGDNGAPPPPQTRDGYSAIA